MTTNQFWAIIEQSKSEINSERAIDLQKLEQELNLLEPSQVLSFSRLLQEYKVACCRSDIISVLKIISGHDCCLCYGSFQCLHRAMNWLIGQGRERYEAALASPEIIGSWPEIDQVAPRIEEAECWQDLCCIAPSVYVSKSKQKTRAWFHIHKELWKIKWPRRPKGERIKGPRWIDKKYPELSKRFEWVTYK